MEHKKTRQNIVTNSAGMDAVTGPTIFFRKTLQLTKTGKSIKYTSNQSH